MRMRMIRNIPIDRRAASLDLLIQLLPRIQAVCDMVLELDPTMLDIAFADILLADQIRAVLVQRPLPPLRFFLDELLG